jgi:hypothetical protein
LLESDGAFDMRLVDFCRKIGATYHRQNEAGGIRSGCARPWNAA